MSDKFSLYQTDGLWGIIENASDKKQTSIKSYFGSDLIVKLLNEQADQIDQLKQENETLFLQLSKQEIDEHKPVYCTLAGNDCKYLGKIKELKQQLAEKEKENEELKLKLDIRAMNLQNINTERMEAVRNQTQLAIQELEKVKINLKDRITMMGNKEHSYLQKVVSWYDICDQINNQIKQLKEGE